MEQFCECVPYSFSRLGEWYTSRTASLNDALVGLYICRSGSMQGPEPRCGDLMQWPQPAFRTLRNARTIRKSRELTLSHLYRLSNGSLSGLKPSELVLLRFCKMDLWLLTSEHGQYICIAYIVDLDCSSSHFSSPFNANSALPAPPHCQTYRRICPRPSQSLSMVYLS